MDKAELNATILTVLRAESEKDAPYAFQRLRQLDYKIVKARDGQNQYMVYDLRTGKGVCLKSRHRNASLILIGTTNRWVVAKRIKKVDIVNFLSVKKNMDYQVEIQRWRARHTADFIRLGVYHPNGTFRWYIKV